MTTVNGAASSAPGSLAFDAIGPFQSTPPDKFDGKKENFEEFAFKFKAWFFLMVPGYVNAFREPGGSPDAEITDAAFIDEKMIRYLHGLRWQDNYSGLR